MIKNEKCPCTKVNCSLHGNCKQCIEKHKNSNNFTACQSEKMFIIK